MWRYSSFYYTILLFMVISWAWSFLAFTNNNTTASIVGAVISFILFLWLHKMDPEIKFKKEKRDERTRR